MNNNQASEKSQVHLSIELNSSLRRLLDSSDSLHEAVHSSLVQSLTEIMEMLGIPGSPVVEITAAEENSLYPGRILRVFVNGQLCRYPDELLQRVYSYVNEDLPDLAAKSGNILTRLNDLSHDPDLGREKVAEFLCLTCLEIIKRQPDVLLGLDQALDYIVSLPDPSPETTLQAKRLLPILRNVLALKISLADKQRVAEILRSAQGRSQEDVCEDLIAALRPNIIEIQLSLEYLKQITTTDEVNGPRLFTVLREDIFQDFSLTYPPFCFVPVEHLKPRSFAFKINHLTMLPWIGLLPNQYLVNDTTDTLASLNIKSSAVANPLTGAKGRLIDMSSQDPAAIANLTTFNQTFYLILCFDINLRENAACFLHRQLVQDQLEQLELVYPALIKALQSEVATARIVRVLRALVSEEIPIKNLRLILESLLDYQYRVAALLSQAHEGAADTPGQAKDIRWDDFPYLISYVRSALKRQIRQKFSGGTNTIEAYSLAPDFQRFLLEHLSARTAGDEHPVLDEDENDRIVQAVRTTLGSPPPTALIITTIEIRPFLRKIIASDFPRVPVLAFQELPPDTKYSTSYPDLTIPGRE